MINRDSLAKKPSFFYFYAPAYFLLIAACFDVRGPRIAIGDFSFYLTTARLAILMTVLISLFWFFNKGVSELWRHYRGIFISSVGFWVSIFISAWFSYPSGPVLEQACYYGAMIYLFLFFLSAREFAGWVSVMRLVFALGLVLGVMAVFEQFSFGVWNFFDSVFRPMSHQDLVFRGRSLASMQNPTTLGACLAMASISGLLTKAGGGYFMILGQAILFSGAVLSQSRISVLVMTGIFIGYGIWCVLDRSLQGRVKLAYAVALMAALSIIPWAPRLGNSLQALPESLVSHDKMNVLLSKRIEIWGDAWSLWRGHPWLGVGLGNFKYYAGEIAGHAHNLFLRILCETGLFGMAMFLLMNIQIVWFLSKERVSRWIWLLGVFLIFELFEELTRDPYPALLFIMAAASALSVPLGKKRLLDGPWSELGANCDINPKIKVSFGRFRFLFFDGGRA